MAVIDFPSSPTMGQEYTFGDFVYVWDGVKWTTQVTVVADNHVLKSGDTMTGDLTIHPSGANKVSTSVIAGEVGINFSNEDGTRVGKWSVNNAGNTEIYHIQSDGSIKEVALKTYPDTSEVGIVTPFMFGNQGTRGESLTRKDYVDNGFVKKAGDTMTGDLSVIGNNSNGVSLGLGTSGNGGVISFYDANGELVSQLYSTRAADGSSFNFGISSQTSDGGALDSILNYVGTDRKVILTSPHSSSVQSTDSNALTRKDYVDAALLVKADVDRVNTLEATITALLARIEALEAQVNPAP